MDGLKFIQGYLLAVGQKEGAPAYSVFYYHGGYVPYTVTTITQPDIDRLIGEKLIRELV